MNFTINDMYDALNHLTGAMAGAKTVKVNSIDHSYITPTIIALGDFSDSKVNELVQLTQGEPTVIWNLGSKPLSNVVKMAFQNQIIDAHWKTPCQYTRAPLLETVFSLCQSIKSWYDINERNLTIVHCPTGQPSTGIVIACLLKYIGAFEHAAHAYDFYCSKRLKGDPAHTLAPSYRNLFTNVDKIVDNDGYANHDPRYLKTITIAGLPVEEIPCVEVWDINGMIFSSHTGWNADPSCTWNTDYGDGFFKISKFLLGDFSIICRFGGNLAGTKDKSTLIFKYQNTTAFLFDEILELKATDVDINPQYSESLDVEIFTVHLMFENNPTLTPNPKLRLKDSDVMRLASFPKVGLEAFEAGLDEISKLHSIVPDPKKFSDLIEKGTMEKYLAVALQLSNNHAAAALDFVSLMESRVKELQQAMSQRQSLAPSPEVMALTSVGSFIENITDGDGRGSGPVSEEDWEVVDVGCAVCKEDNLSKADQLIVCSTCPRHYHTYCVGLRKIPPFGTKSDQDILIREKYIRRHFGEWKCPRCTQQSPTISSAQGQEKEKSLRTDDDFTRASSSSPSLQQDQQRTQAHLMSSPSSRQSYSVSTSGGGVIVTEKIRTMTSPTGQPFPQTFPSIALSTKGKTSLLNTSLQQHPMSPNFRSKQDSIAILVAMLSSAGVGMEELMGMTEEKQKEVILGVIAKRHPEFSFEGIKDQKGNLDLATALKGILATAQGKNGLPVTAETKLTTTVIKPSNSIDELEEEQTSFYKNETAIGGSKTSISSKALTKSPVRLSSHDVPTDGVDGGNGNGTGSGNLGGSGSGNGVGSEKESKKTVDPRAAMLENLKKRQMQGSVGSSKLGQGQGIGQNGGDATNSSSVGSGDIRQRSRSGSNLSFLNTLTISKGSVDTTKAKDIPELGDIFHQLKAGASKAALADKIVAQGIVDNTDMANALLSLDPEKPLPPDFKQKFNILVTLATHPKYEKFYKMLKVGISKDIVKAKMADNGLDPSVIDKDPESTVPLTGNLPFEGMIGASRSGDDNVFVSVEEQHKYVKYVKMTQMGIPLEQVKKKMQEEGLDPNNLHRLPPLRGSGGSGSGSGIGGGGGGTGTGTGGAGNGPGSGPGNGSGTGSGVNLSSPSNEKVALSDHPKYAKYFKMLKIGLDKEAVKAKMQLEGVDSSILDKDPKELVPLHETPSKASDEKGKEKVAIKDHPKYSKFFQMMKVGVPLDSIKGKMVAEGLDPKILEKDPNELIPLQDEDEGPKVPVSEHPVYSKFFKMLKVGLPMHMIKAKMEAEGVNASMIEKDPNELIPLEEKKAEVAKVPASEHPAYSKFFKMLKMGVPADIVKAKMTLEKVDASVLDKDPSELIPLEEQKAAPATGLGGLFGGAVAANKLMKGQKQRKKKLHWRAIGQVNENSLWADQNDDELNIHFDEAEFNQLFVEPESDKSGKAATAAKAAADAKKKKEAKKQRVVLIDMKRAQNGGIALARIRFDFDELKRKIMNMEDDGITTDQLKSLIEYLPTPEESGSLRNYRGEMDVVGVAERYMMTMLGFSSAEKRIQCMIYKQQFRSRYLECRTKITKIQNACDDVKLSARLKKVLKYILRVGNQLNDGEEHKGFTVDSLLKLQSAKAYDKKTTVLQYVITLIFRSDEDILKFPEELKHVSEAARLSFDIIASEKNALRTEFATNLNIVEDICNNDTDSDTNAMLDFLTKADQQCTELERGFDKAKEKFSGVLVYFGEDANMTSQDFFSTLFKFIQEFIAVRDTVDRMRKLEQKRQQQQQQQLQNNQPKPSRRATTTFVQNDNGEPIAAQPVRRSGSGERGGQVRKSSSGDDQSHASSNNSVAQDKVKEKPPPAETEEQEDTGGRPAFLNDIANMAKKSNRRKSNFV